MDERDFERLLLGVIGGLLLWGVCVQPLVIAFGR